MTSLNFSKTLLSKKNIIRLWSAIMGDFEVCTDRFLAQDGLAYKDWCKVAKDMKLPLILNATVTHGSSQKDEHYDIVSRIIFDTARDFWLRADPDKDKSKMEEESNFFGVSDNLAGKIGDLTFKRRLAGFYLTYAMYRKQPIAQRTKILVALEELKQIKAFMADVEQLRDKALAFNIKFLFEVMKELEAFQIAAFSTIYGIEPWRRYLLTMRDYSTHNFEDKEAQEMLNCAGDTKGLVQKATDYALSAITVFREYASSAAFPESVQTALKLQENLGGSTVVNELISAGASKVETLGAMPVMGMKQLVFDEIIERKMMAEYRKRLRKVVEDLKNPAGKKKPKREYIKAGSFWGKKKDEDDDQRADREEMKQRRERGVFSRNLFVFLNDLPFDYKPPSVANADGTNPPKTQANFPSTRPAIVGAEAAAVNNGLADVSLD